MIGYASRTGTKRNLAALRAAGWRLMVSATGVHRSEGFRYALDNGAWTAHTTGEAWNRTAFENLIGSHGSGADFIVCPDVVGDASKTIQRYRYWLPLLVTVAPVLVAMQDGMDEWNAREALDLGARGVFLGGSDTYKRQSLGYWGDVSGRTGCYFHVGRVNSEWLIIRCRQAAADSFDGSGPSRFASETPRLDRARRTVGERIKQTLISFVPKRDPHSTPAPRDGAE